MDIEGIAVNDDTLYVVGSHSLVRKIVKAKDKYNDIRIHNDAFILHTHYCLHSLWP